MNTNFPEKGIEIDFLPAGNGSRSADAIAIRYGNLSSNDRSQHKIIIIDGGYKENGRALVEHVKTYYKTDIVDIVIMTHPDLDHCSGLTEVLNNITVRELWMHQPWNHSDEILNLFKDGRLTTNSLEKKLQVALDSAFAVEEVAEGKTKIIEPFADHKSADGVITVLGPTREYYQELIPQFRKTPESKTEEILTEAKGKVFSVINWIKETLHISTETLGNEGKTSCENNSSVILLFQIGEEKFLFTGDAGIPALESATQYAASKGISLLGLRWMQVPHHGSKRNIGSNLLDKLKPQTAFVSVSKNDGHKHPSKKVINAFIRRGTSVFTTEGLGICHFYNSPGRLGWSSLAPQVFNDNVEE